jgi:hypothetical protein
MRLRAASIVRDCNFAGNQSAASPPEVTRSALPRAAVEPFGHAITRPTSYQRELDDWVCPDFVRLAATGEQV